MATTAPFDSLKEAAEKVSVMKNTPQAAKVYSAILEKLRTIFTGGKSDTLVADIAELKTVGKKMRSGTDMSSAEADAEAA